MDQQVRSLPFMARTYYSVTELSESVIARWRALEECAFENNVYMSPDFIIPAVKYLTPAADIVIVTVEEFNGGQPCMIALGVFDSKKRGKHFPFPYLRAYQCRHSFLGGVLLDKCKPDYALNILLSSIKRSGKWHAVQFDWRPINKVVEKEIGEVLRENNIRWHQSGMMRRAILTPRESGVEYLDRILTKKKKKTFSRRIRQLEKLGRLEWRFIQDENRVMQAAEDFVRLENDGWKRERGSSIASRASDMKFFMTVIANCAARRKVFFTEFRLNGEAISSTCNFTSGKTGFAFKLGWDERFAKQGLGLLSEYELVKRAPEVISDLEFVDSGTLPGSYLECLWREYRMLVSGFYSLNLRASLYLSALGILREIRTGPRAIIMLMLVFIMVSLNFTG